MMSSSQASGGGSDTGEGLRCDRGTCRGIGSATPAVLLVLCIVCPPGPVAQAQQSCSSAIELGVSTTPPFAIGSRVGVDYRISSNSIQGGSSLDVQRAFFALDCDDSTLFDLCRPDAGRMRYGGDASLSTNCDVAGVRSDQPDGSGGNIVTFTFENADGGSAALKLPAEQACTISFEVVVEAVDGTAGPPGLINLAAAFDSSCDNGLVGSARAGIALEVEEVCACALVVDADSLAADVLAVVEEAETLDVAADELLELASDDGLLWSVVFSGGDVVLPGGFVGDEGFFGLGFDLAVPLSDLLRDRLDRSLLASVEGVVPLGNTALAGLVGRSCVALLADGDVAVDYQSTVRADLTGLRSGVLSLTIVDVRVPSPTTEQQDEHSLYDVVVRIDPHDPDFCALPLDVAARSAAPDDLTILEARSVPRRAHLAIIARSSLGDAASVSVSVEGLFREVPMIYNAAQQQHQLILRSRQPLSGRAVIVSTPTGGAATAIID